MVEDFGDDVWLCDECDYDHWLADQAHLRGLAIGLKNDLDQVTVLVDWFDFAVNEECHDYTESDLLQPFVTAGKPVFNAEYTDSLSQARTASPPSAPPPSARIYARSSCSGTSTTPLALAATDAPLTRVRIVFTYYR